MRCVEVRHQPPQYRAPARPRRCARPVRGFTIVEMGVVVAIIGILTALAVPALRDFIGARATEAYAEELVYTMRQARSEAIKRGLEVSVCAGSDVDKSTAACSGSNTWAAGGVGFVDYDRNGSLGGNDMKVRIYAAPAGVKSVTTTVTSLTMARTGILLLINGATVADGTSASFVIKPQSGSDRTARTVCVNKQGRVSVSKGVLTCA